MLKLSILVFCYNQEKTIKETLKSILSQEHKYKYELIVCDDSSKDSTPSIIKEFYNEYPDIIKPIIRQKNLGLIRNYYDGISHVQGEYIMVCAGDDYWLPGKVKTQVEYLDSHPDVGLVYGDAVCENSKGVRTHVITGFNDNTFIRLIRGNYISAPTICIRHKTFSYFINDIKPIDHNWEMEDYPLLLWVSTNSKIDYISGVCVVYRVLIDSACHPSKIDKIISFNESVRDIRMFFLLRNGCAIKYSREFSNKLLFESLFILKNIKNRKINTYMYNLLSICGYSKFHNIYYKLMLKYPIAYKALVSIKYVIFHPNKSIRRILKCS